MSQNTSSFLKIGRWWNDRNYAIHKRINYLWTLDKDHNKNKNNNLYKKRGPEKAG